MDEFTKEEFQTAALFTVIMAMCVEKGGSFVVSRDMMETAWQEALTNDLDIDLLDNGDVMVMMVERE